MIGLNYESSKPQEVINSACRRVLKRKRPSSGKWQSLEDRLLDCYIESCEGAPKDKRFCHGVRLLEKVVLQDNLSTLVVKLYPRNEGYSLMLKDKNGADSETVRLPYEESEFLDYLDAQELPPILVDLLEKSQANIFYSGCVIVEVRDYRHSPSGSTYESNYVLLRPTYQVMCQAHLGGGLSEHDMFLAEVLREMSEMRAGSTSKVLMWSIKEVCLASLACLVK